MREWKLSKKEEERRERIYKSYREMREVMGASYPEFNNRTPAQFLDDNQKRANGYVTTRAEQGKDEWQSNVFTPFTRNKIKAHIASVAKDVPQISMTAVNASNQVSFMRANVMKELVRASYVEKGNNPEKVIVNDCWNGAVNGTVIKYDGYVRRKEKNRPIKAYDPVTGELELGDEEEVIVEDRCVEVNIPVHHLYIRNPYITDIQEQPELIWRKLYTDRDAFLADWGNYKNADAVPSIGSFSSDEIRTFFGESENDAVSQYQKKIEVIRYYSKVKNEYIVYANRIELFSSPLLWGKNKKIYPFAKDVFEQFANADFFWGNALPNILMGDQDTANAFLNAMNDKTYRSLHAPRLVDIENRDALEQESEYITGDMNIYVRNVEGVKPMPVDSVSQAELAMLDRTMRGIDLASVDSAQQGVSGSGSTAREIVIANQRADEIKGLFFINMKNLWLQKFVLRTQNILIHYSDTTKVETIVGKNKADVFRKQFNVPNATLADGTTGMMQVNVFSQQEQMPTPAQIDVQEQALKSIGQNVGIINITSDYLDNWEYFIQLETETFRSKDKALDMAKAKEKLDTVVQHFPEKFAANKDEFFSDFMMSFDDDPERYNKMPAPQPMMPQEAGGQGGGNALAAMAGGAMPTAAGGLGALAGVTA